MRFTTAPRLTHQVGRAVAARIGRHVTVRGTAFSVPGRDGYPLTITITPAEDRRPTMVAHHADQAARIHVTNWHSEDVITETLLREGIALGWWPA